MFTVDLVRLEREGSLRFDETIQPDDPLWEDSGLEFAGAVSVGLDLSQTGTGQVVGRGRMHGRLSQACRRCLEPVETEVELELDLVWVVPDELEPDDDGELRKLDPTAMELEVGEALREEFLLHAPRFAICGEGCKGLCPRCGVNRNDVTCECSFEEPDPRWDALRALKND